MKFPDIFLTLDPLQNFPDIFSNSLTIPWPRKNLFFPYFSLTCGNPDWSYRSLVQSRRYIIVCIDLKFRILLLESIEAPKASEAHAEFQIDIDLKNNLSSTKFLEI